MKFELQEELFAIEPKWFVRGDIQKSLMAFGFEVGDGWFKLLREGMESIKRHLESLPEPIRFEVVQVKEKFGTLRFYADGGDPFARKLIEGMETESAHICEDCGDVGHTRLDLGWVRTLCESCYDSFLAGN
jgi:hypothetical protein